MTHAARHRILSACYKLMLPIARLLLNSGIGYREFDIACKQAFVHTASKEFGVRGRETNASRIAAMTGIPRKQVQELRKKLMYDAPEPRQLLSPLADLLRIWATTNEYQGADGSPIELVTDDSNGKSFQQLVRSCMGDVPPGAVKTELLRMGVVSATSINRLALKRRTLIPDQVDERIESSIVYSLRGLAETVAHNGDPKVSASDRLFERFVESQPMTESEIRKIRVLARTKLTEISEELDSLLNPEPIRSADSPGQRVGIGLYFTE